ncbi:hypothetical protein CA235_17095 [Sphingomonas sp. ABOLF]|nr:hypothetical protein CA235_17095 [Sphingomonas sp. ABOLF]
MEESSVPDHTAHAAPVNQRDCDAFGLVERALCLIESGGSGSTRYAELLRAAMDAAAEAGVSPSHRGQ